MKHDQPLQRCYACFLVFAQKLYSQGADRLLIIEEVFLLLMQHRILRTCLDMRDASKRSWRVRSAILRRAGVAKGLLR